MPSNFATSPNVALGKSFTLSETRFLQLLNGATMPALYFSYKVLQTILTIPRMSASPAMFSPRHLCSATLNCLTSRSRIFSFIPPHFYKRCFYTRYSLSLEGHSSANPTGKLLLILQDSVHKQHLLCEACPGCSLALLADGLKLHARTEL